MASETDKEKEYIPTFDIELKDTREDDKFYMDYTGVYTKGGCGVRGSYIEFIGKNSGKVTTDPNNLLTEKRDHGSGDVRGNDFNEIEKLITNGDSDDKLFTKLSDFQKWAQHYDHVLSYDIEDLELYCDNWEKLVKECKNPAWYCSIHGSVFFTSDLKACIAEVQRANELATKEDVLFGWI